MPILGRQETKKVPVASDALQVGHGALLYVQRGGRGWKYYFRVLLTKIRVPFLKSAAILQQEVSGEDLVVKTTKTVKPVDCTTVFWTDSSITM